MRLDHVELLCKVLVCEPGDLLLWVPGNGDNLSENHPLNKLKQGEMVGDLKETIAKMPYRDLKEVTKSITVNNKNTG